jgi:hypothetical protein
MLLRLFVTLLSLAIVTRDVECVFVVLRRLIVLPSMLMVTVRSLTFVSIWETTNKHSRREGHPCLDPSRVINYTLGSNDAV